MNPRRAALCVRVSTDKQTVENQIAPPQQQPLLPTPPRRNLLRLREACWRTIAFYLTIVLAITLGAAAHADDKSRYIFRDNDNGLSCAKLKSLNAARKELRGNAGLKALPRRCIPIKNRPPRVYTDKDQVIKGWVCTNTEYYDKKGRFGTICGPADQNWTLWENGKAATYEDAFH